MKMASLCFVCAFALFFSHAKAQEEIDPLAELVALGEEMGAAGPEGGGSIRAKKDADLTVTKRLRDPNNLEARVQSVSKRGFPIVAITLSVTRPASQGEGKKMARNAKLVVVPKLKADKQNIDMKDAATLINAGSFYLKKGDRVMVRLGEKKGKFWEAEYIERK